MSDELKESMETLTGSVVELATAVKEAKEEWGENKPADVEDRLTKLSEDVLTMSDTVKRIDESPALKRAFDVDPDTETKQMEFKRKLQVPSSVSGDEDIQRIHELQDTIEIMRFVKRHDSSFHVENTKSYKELQSILERRMGTKAVYDGETATQGLEWIPTGYSPDLIMVYELQRKIASLFTEIAMPQDPFVFPTQLTRASVYIKARAVNATETESTTGNLTLSTTTIAAYEKVAYEMEEDSIIAMLPFIRQDLAYGLADGEEDCLLNGDTTATHFDSDVTGGTDVRKSWKGLRRLAVDGSDTYDMGAVSIDAIRYCRGMMGKYAVSPSRLVWIVSPIGLLHLLGMDEVITLDKYGPSATVITGELARVDGTPIVVSGMMREDLQATGVYDTSAGNYTGMLLVNTMGFILGRRRAPMIESFRDVIAGVDEIVVSMRKDFQKRYPTDQPLNVWAYDIPNTVSVSS